MGYLSGLILLLLFVVICAFLLGRSRSAAGTRDPLAYDALKHQEGGDGREIPAEQAGSEQLRESEEAHIGHKGV